jgi:hypothetical protein
MATAALARVEEFSASTGSEAASHVGLGSNQWVVQISGDYELDRPVMLTSASAQVLAAPLDDWRVGVHSYLQAVTATRRLFAERIADTLEERYLHQSSMRPIRRDPDLVQLVNLGSIAKTVALSRLTMHEPHRPLWLYVLQLLTGERPAAGADGLDAATAAWRAWGRRHRLIP